jgi:glucose/arabinose dehydrogenase
MRARLKGNRLTDQQILFTGSPATDKGHHLGMQARIRREGYLFFGVGERDNISISSTARQYEWQDPPDS